MIGAYLLHLSNGTHYCGWLSDVHRRLAEHQSGNGCVTTGRAVRAGPTLDLVAVWPGADTAVERAIKRSPPVSAFCPWCNKRPRRSQAWAAVILIPRKPLEGWPRGVCQPHRFTGADG